MLEFLTTRHNPMIDPTLHVWGWEIPVYLFLGGWVAGSMVLSGWLVHRDGGRGPGSVSVSLPWLSLVLISLGMGALFLDLEHKRYVWRMYLTLQPASPMSWGGWILLLVYPVLLLTALASVPRALLVRWPSLEALADRTRSAATMRWLANLNVAVGVALGIYTGILLSTMVARPLWNVSILGPLFLVSGLSAGAALLHLMSAVLPPRRPAPQGMIGGAIGALVQPLGAQPPEKRTADSLIRADIGLLAIELLMLGLLLIGLVTASASHAAAFELLMSGRFAVAFWGVLVVLGIVVPLLLQGLELGHRIPHTIVPAVLVLVGGYTLRWLMVNAGQVSEVVSTASRF